MHLDRDGYEKVTKYMYLALGKANEATAPASFDAAPVNFLLIACDGEAQCDFSGAAQEPSAVTEIALE